MFFNAESVYWTIEIGSQLTGDFAPGTNDGRQSLPGWRRTGAGGGDILSPDDGIE